MIGHGPPCMSWPRQRALYDVTLVRALLAPGTRRAIGSAAVDGCCPARLDACSWLDGWRSFWWLEVALSAFSILLVALTFPETKYHRSNDGSDAFHGFTSFILTLALARVARRPDQDYGCACVTFGLSPPPLGFAAPGDCVKNCLNRSANGPSELAMMDFTAGATFW